MRKFEIGMTVGFKSDIEQYGTVIAIKGSRLTLENDYGFDGDYIGGETLTTVDKRDAWVDEWIEEDMRGTLPC